MALSRIATQQIDRPLSPHKQIAANGNQNSLGHIDAHHAQRPIREGEQQHREHHQQHDQQRPAFGVPAMRLLRSVQSVLDFVEQLQDKKGQSRPRITGVIAAPEWAL